MKEALHIFLKDSRYLKYPVAVVLAWTAIFLAASALPVQPVQQLASWFDTLGFVVPSLSNYLLPIGWAFLIVRAFHADAIPGDRQFWLTRPYSRASLFGAKALFVLAYIIVPFALAQLVIVVLRGFPVGPSIPGMLWSQVLILAIVVFPAAALATVTSKLTQFVVVALAAPLLILTNSLAPQWGALAWVRSSLEIAIALAVTTAVLFVQFTRRRTGASRLIAIAGIAAIVAAMALVPWQTAFALQSRIAQARNGQLTAQLVPQPVIDPRLRPLGVLPLQLDGLPPETAIACEATEATIEDRDTSWKTGLRIRTGETKSTVSEGCNVVLTDAIVNQAGTRPVNVHAAIYVTVFGSELPITVPIDQPPTVIPGAGLCIGSTDREVVSIASQTAAHTWASVNCVSAFREPRRLMQVSRREGADVRWGRLSYSPFPADLRISPIQAAAYFSSRPAPVATIIARDPVAHIKVVIDVRGVNLRNFLR